MADKIKVIIVDDSALAGQAFIAAVEQIPAAISENGMRLNRLTRG